MSIFRDYFVKQKPVFTGISRGAGGFSFGGSAGEAGFTQTGSATGGTVVTDAGIKYHIFGDTGPSPFSVTGTLSQANLLLIGGGGSGSNGYGSAGGGAGSVVHATELTCPSGSYTVTIGEGGSGVIGPGEASCEGNPGTPSTLTLGSQPYIATGGGGGGSGHSSSPQARVIGKPGGSGGGGGYYYNSEPRYPNPGGNAVAPPTSALTGPTTQAGGRAYGSPGGLGSYGFVGQCGGGGGGASEAGFGGASPNPPTYGKGGDGISISDLPATIISPGIPTTPFPGARAPGVAGSPYPSPSATTYRAAFTAAVGPTGLYGGGGGAGHSGGPWVGGTGGGGQGGSTAPQVGKWGVPGTGGGGGAAASGSQAQVSGTGGSGICVIYYPT